MVSVLFGRSAARHHLLSFPTRRSSDLFHIFTFIAGATTTGAVVARYRVVKKSRSEEHTSELQSHSDLVCRHRLEKKHALCMETEHCQTHDQRRAPGKPSRVTGERVAEE